MKMNLRNCKSYIDKRGYIKMILESCLVRSISRIVSMPKTTRANHWHKEDSHYILINSGKIEIYERPVGSNEIPTKTVLINGDIHYTGPNIEHTMYFPIKTSFDCYSYLNRKQEKYEEDTIRFDYSLRDIYLEHCNPN